MVQQFNQLSKSLQDDFKIYADLPGHTVTGGTLPPNIVPTAQRPDIIIINNTKKAVHIIELTSPFENNIQKAHDLKMSRYENLQSDIAQEGYKCYLNCIEIGSRGLVTADNMNRLGKSIKFLSGKSSTVKQFSREFKAKSLSSAVILFGMLATSPTGTLHHA